GAYDTKQCRQVIADRQAHAVIPPRKNAKPWKDKKMGSLERNELLEQLNV
ncbi:tnpA domain protein, partial [Acinetobacter baumannii 1045092]